MKSQDDGGVIEQALRIEKARLEIDALKRSMRPGYRNSAVLFGIITALVGVVGVTIQWRDARRDADIAELKVTFANKQLADTRKELGQTENRVREMRSELSAMQEQLRSESGDLEATSSRLSSAKASLAAMQLQERKFKSKIDEASKRLEDLATLTLASKGSSGELVSKAEDAIRSVYEAKKTQLSELRLPKFSEVPDPQSNWDGFKGDYAMEKAGLQEQLRELEARYPWLNTGRQ